jgi:hypothetical protein
MARTQYTSAARAGLNRNGGLRMVARTLNHVESPELVSRDNLDETGATIMMRRGGRMG